MSAFLNRIATPLTTSLFLVSLITGLALFFHVGPGGFRGAHEWLSVVLILPFVLHVWRNWRAFTLYFRRPAVMTVSLILGVVATGFFLMPSDNTSAGGPPQFALANMLMQQSPATIAPMLGQTSQSLVSALAAQGIEITDPTQPLAGQAGDRDTAGLSAALLAVGQN